MRGLAILGLLILLVLVVSGVIYVQRSDDKVNITIDKGRLRDTGEKLRQEGDKALHETGEAMERTGKKLQSAEPAPQ